MCRDVACYVSPASISDDGKKKRDVTSNVSTTVRNTGAKAGPSAKLNDRAVKRPH